MAIQATCENGHDLKVEDKFAGRTGRCPKCKAPVHIPALPDEIADVDFDEPAAVNKPVTRSKPKKGKQPAKRESSGTSPMKLVLLLVLLAGAGAAGYYSYTQLNRDPAVDRAERIAKMEAMNKQRMEDAKNIKIDPNLKKTPDITGGEGGFGTGSGTRTPVETGDAEIAEAGADGASAGDAEIENVVTTFLEAGKADDLEAARDQLTENAKANFVFNDRNQVSPESTVEIGQVMSQGDVGQATITIRGTGLDAVMYLNLRRENGEWRIFGMGVGDPNNPATAMIARMMFMNFEIAAPNAGQDAR